MAERCHGATTMTDTTMFLTEKPGSKLRMWGGFVCSRSCLVFFLLNWIFIQSFMYFQEQTRCQEFTSKLNSIVDSQEDIYSLINSFIKHMEKNDIDSIRGTQNKPTIYAIMPTFARPVQKAELTRLSQTFLHIPNFHWILIEDAAEKTHMVTKFLQQSGLAYTHLAAQTPSNYKLGRNDPNWKKPRGVEQRNAALKWLRKNLGPSDNGVVYFADDDNTYSIKLFKEMEKIQKVGVWPVGLVGGLMVEKPICDNVTNKVIDFNAAWKPDRPFPIDMAGFAVKLNLILENKDAEFSYDVQGGYQESEILRQIVTRDELEPLADFCTKVYVWHTRTEPPQLKVEQQLIQKGKPSNTGIEV